MTAMLLMIMVMIWTLLWLLWLCSGVVPLGAGSGNGVVICVRLIVATQSLLLQLLLRLLYTLLRLGSDSASLEVV